MSGPRQQVPHLCLSDSRLSSKVIGWAFHDPTDAAGPGIPDPAADTPYERGTDAPRDGWRLIQASQLLPPQPDGEHSVSHQPFEFILERIIEAPPSGWPRRSVGTRPRRRAAMPVPPPISGALERAGDLAIVFDAPWVHL